MGFIFPALSPVEPKGSCLDDDLGLSVPQKGQARALIFSQRSMEGLVGSTSPGLACIKNKKTSGKNQQLQWTGFGNVNKIILEILKIFHYLLRNPKSFYALHNCLLSLETEYEEPFKGMTYP